MAKPFAQSLSAGLLGLALFLAGDALAAVINYDIVYVRQPRFGDTNNTTWPEVFHPARLDPGADLMLLHTILCSPDLTAPFSTWTAATIFSATVEPNQIRRLEAELPPGIADRCLLIVRQE